MKAKLSLLAERRTQISLLLTIIALLLWSHSILYARFEIGYFGLIHGLPVTFFIALAFLTVASAILWVSTEKHGKLLCLQLLILISALWLVPLITGGSPPFLGHGYRNLGMIDYILNYGHFDSARLWYQAWPGLFIISAAGIKIGSLNFEPLLSIFPFLMQLLYLLPVYVFLRNTLGKARVNYCWAGCWLFYLAQWCGQDYLSPQGMAFFLLLTLLALVSSSSVWERNAKSFALLTLAILVFAALVVTHLLTSLAGLCILAILCIVKRNKWVAPAVLFCLLLLVSWDIIGGPHYMQYGMSQLLVTTSEIEPGILTLDPAVVVQREIIGHLSGSQSHIAVAKTRALFSSVFALIGFAGVILTFVFRKNYKVAAPILAITLAPLVLLPLSGRYGVELLHRLYLFSLLGMAYFGASLLDIRSRMPTIILCLLLTTCCPLHIISHYGNQKLDYFPPGQVVGLNFFDCATDCGYVTGGYPLGRTSNVLNYQYIGFAELEGQGSRLTTSVPVEEEMPHYVGISRQNHVSYRWFHGDTHFMDEVEQLLNIAVNCNLIYSNPDLRLYVKE